MVINEYITVVKEQSVSDLYDRAVPSSSEQCRVHCDVFAAVPLSFRVIFFNSSCYTLYW